MCHLKCCNATGLRVWAIVCTLFAIALFTIAVFLPPVIDSILEKALDDTILIDASTQADNKQSYRTWVNPDDPDATPVYYNTYMYNLTNPVETWNGAQPIFKELGPYVYHKKEYKQEVVFSKDVYNKDIVTYLTRTDYVFDSSRSAAGLTTDDMITNVNPVWVLTAPSSAQACLLGVPAYCSGDSPSVWFTTKKVTDWLFGYPDSVLLALHTAQPTVPAAFPGYIGSNGANDTGKDIQYVGTKPDQQLIREYIQVSGETTLTTTSLATGDVSPTWASNRANMIGGTDGAQFPRDIQDEQTVQVWVSQLYRIVTLGNADGASVKFKGITMKKFTLPDIFLGNAQEYPANADFYMFGFRGVANLTAAGYTNFYVSKPHFLDTNQTLINSVSGLSAPSTAEHDTFINIEPLSGASMQVAKRLQLAIRLTPVDTVYYGTWGSNLPNQQTTGGQYCPIYWVEEYAEISDSQANTFTSQVYGAQKLRLALLIIGEALGCILAILSVVLLILSGNKMAHDNNSVVPLSTETR